MSNALDTNLMKLYILYIDLILHNYNNGQGQILIILIITTNEKNFNIENYWSIFQIVHENSEVPLTQKTRFRKLYT